MRSKALDDKSQDRSRSDESGPELGRRERLRRGRMGARLVQPDEGGQDQGDGDEEQTSMEMPRLDAYLASQFMDHKHLKGVLH